MGEEVTSIHILSLSKFQFLRLIHSKRNIAGRQVVDSDYTRARLHFLWKKTSHWFKQVDTQMSSYFDTAKLAQWSEMAGFPTMVVDNVVEVNPETDGNSQQLLSRCIVGTFNDPFNHNPNRKWLKLVLDRWKVCAGMKVISLTHNQFLIEPPSGQDSWGFTMIGCGMDSV